MSARHFADAATVALDPDTSGELTALARGVLGLPPAPAPAAAPAWRQALDRAIAADPRGKLGVAERLGVSRPYVSRITTGDIPQASPRFIQRVIDVYLQVDCPHLRRSLPPGQCRAYATRAYADIAREDVPHWRACRRCPQRPQPAHPTSKASHDPQKP